MKTSFHVAPVCLLIISNGRVYFSLLLVALLMPYAAHGQWVRSTGEAGGAVCLLSVPGGAGGNTLFAGSNGVVRSTDNGASWVATGTGLPPVGVMAIASSGTHLFAGTWGYGVYSSNDNGASWSAVNNLALENSHVNALVAVPGGSASILLVGTNEAGVYRTSNNGATWGRADTGLVMLNWRCASLAVSPDLPENVFAATDNGVFRSTDNGTRWTSTGLSVSIYAIAAKSTGSGTGVEIFAGMNNGHVYYYDGTTWSTRDIIGAVALGSVKCFTFTGSGVVAGVGYIGGGAFLSTNNGTKWTNVSIGMTWVVSSSVYGYVISGDRIVAVTGEGIWWRLLSDLPSAVIIRNPAGNELVQADKQYDIRWESSGIDSLRIEFSVDSGATYQQVVRSAPANAGLYRWTVPDTLSAKCKIRTTNIASGSLGKPTATTWESGLFKLKGYRLTRFTWNGDFEAFDLTKHGWQFENSGANMWPPTWYSQFNYTRTDPVTGQNYPPVFVSPRIRAHPEDFIDWPLFVKALTVSACYQDVSHGVYSPTAIALWAFFKEVYRGSCFGFSQSSLLAFDRPDEFLQAFPEVGTFQNLHDLQLNPDRRKVINQLFGGQYGAQHVQYKRQAVQKTVRQTLEEVKRMLSSTTGDHSSIDLAARGLHSVVPYRLVRDPAVNGILRLSVYDNQCPTGTCANGFTTVIILDSLTNAWIYPPLTWARTDGLGIYLRDPASTYLSPPLIRAGAAQSSRLEFNVTIFSKAASSVIITDTSGNSITLTDSALVNRIAGAVPIIPANATSRTPLGYDLPGGRYSVCLSGFIDSVATFAELTPSGLFTYWRSGAANTQTDRLSSGNGIDIGNPDAQTKTINLQAIESVGSSERVVQILNCPAAQHDSVSISTPDGDPVKFVNRGPQKAYDLNVELAASSGSGKFTHSSVTVPANSTHYIVPHWQDLQHQPVKIYVDFGNNGTVDDSVFVTNQSTDVPLFSTGELPGEFALGQNYPNPFNPSTTIEYAVPERASVELKVVDVLGREVTTLLNEEKPAGAYTVRWNADGMASGVYFYRLKAGDFVRTRKMLLVH